MTRRPAVIEAATHVPSGPADGPSDSRRTYLPWYRLHDRPERNLTLEYSFICGEYRGVIAFCQAPCDRKCKIPYRSAAAAADTLSESIRPRSGSDTRASQLSATRGRSPFPSLPSTTTTRPP